MLPKCLSVVSILGVLGAAGACNGEEAGRAEAKREADMARKRDQAAVKPADHIEVAVAQGKHLPCTQLMDPAAYAAALGEVDPLTVRDETGTMIDSTASCSLIRGGKRPDQKEQDKIIKKVGRLGTLPGDEVCNVTLYCWVVDDAAKFAARCKPTAEEPSQTPDNDSTGGFACKVTHPQGEFDIDSFKFYDSNTRCLFAVRGGPSFTDNDLIATCAKVARTSIKPEHLKPDAPARYELPAPDAGSAAGSSAGSASAGSAAGSSAGSAHL
ncbi:MAG TPA: hypothetical protein VHE35_34045 [Kofleriaceae bacterium]|nr:hypothetical protein [Kofleriaceae bacterium]